MYKTPCVDACACVRWSVFCGGLFDATNGIHIIKHVDTDTRHDTGIDLSTLLIIRENYIIKCNYMCWCRTTPTPKHA
jgi:hypothetical protein